MAAWLGKTMIGNRKTGKVSFTTRFEIEVFQKLRELAFRRDVTPNSLVVEIVTDYLAKLEASEESGADHGRS